MAQSKAQLDNLKKGKATQFHSGDEAVRNGRKGGVRSGESKRNKKTLNQLAQTIAAAPISSKDARKQLASIGFADDDLTNNAMVAAGVFQSAVNGKIEAVEKWEKMLRDADMEGEDNAREKSLAVMRAAFWGNVSSNFGAISVYAIKHKFTHYDAFGGRGSTKSSWASLIGIRLIMEHADIHGLVLRKVGNTLRDSVYAQYMWAIGALGVAEFWDSKISPMDLIYKPTGQRIMFRGADDPMKIKSIKVPFGYIGYTHFEEKDQFSGRAEIRNILQSTMRGGDLFWNVETYNPPISRDNWANKDSAEPRPDRVSHHSTYQDLDDPSWLGEQFLNEAELLKARDERAWRHEYGGEAVGTGGNVFENLELREITNEEISHFDRIYQGVDWGWFPDPYAFIRVHYDVAREVIYVIDECYMQKFSNERSAQWIKDQGYNDVWTACDSAEPKSVADYRSMGINAKEAVKGPGSVDYGMKWLQKRKIVIDRRRTPAAYEEFVNYEYEKNKDDEWISGYPDANNHLIDALRYAMERVYVKYRSNA
jgi:PBSX family phage terminase large subunit